MNHGFTQLARIAGAPAHAVARAVTRTGPPVMNRPSRYVVPGPPVTCAASAPIALDVGTNVRSDGRQTPKRTESISPTPPSAGFACAAVIALAAARLRSSLRRSAAASAAASAAV